MNNTKSNRLKLLAIATASVMTLSSAASYALARAEITPVQGKVASTVKHNFGSTQYVNMLDGAEKKVFLALLAKHGYSRDNSPELFNEIEKTTQAQKLALASTGDWQSAFNGVKTLSAQTSLPVLSPLQVNHESLGSSAVLNEEVSDNVMSFTSSIGELSTQGAVYSGVDSAVPEDTQGVERTLVISSFYDADGKSIGTTALYDSFDNQEVRLRSAVDANYILSNIDPEDQIIHKTFRMVTYSSSIKTLAGDNQAQSTVETNAIALPGTYARSIAEGQQAALEVEMYDPKRIRDVIDGQTHVRVCINRGDVLGKSGCDVPANGNWDLTFPINGKVTLKGKYLLADETNEISASIPGSTDIALWRKSGNEDGIATGKLQGRIDAASNSFKNYIEPTYIVDGTETSTVFSFDIPREDAYFGRATEYEGSGTSPDENEDKKLNWSINMKLFKDESADPFLCELLKQANGTDHCLVPQNLTLSTVNQESSNFLWNGLPKLSFVYGCLAKGTLVMTQSGKMVPIEELAMGEVVKANGMDMTVSSLTTGWEKEMYRIETADEKELLLTSTHPVFTENRGIIWASEIVAGDVVKTLDGATKVVSADKEHYDDRVYNIKVEALAGSENIAQDHNQAFIANGLLVGDAVLQNKLASKNNKRIVLTKEQALATIPQRWHKDYQFLMSKHSRM
ncbi:hypothetical protein SG34_008995 [Thalassomonas viridans]|uniref:Hint domain-containing protein n=1 Tax=Thalassomonas viridans TaxID=137584 RepID=A0AAF0CAM2_9GAMM|nr:Hint domain-containing protein [Thalassomonas viridans]WDE07003.1 hypothetical protein SG34_008995 [Thalassomonas viridans]